MNGKITKKGSRAIILLIQGFALQNGTDLTEDQVLDGVLESITTEKAKTIANYLTRKKQVNENTKEKKIKDGRGRKHEQAYYVLDSKIVKLTKRQEYKVRGVYGGQYPIAVKMLEDQISKTGTQIDHYEALIRKERPIYKQLKANNNFKTKEIQQCVTLS